MRPLQFGRVATGQRMRRHLTGQAFTRRQSVLVGVVDGLLDLRSVLL